MAIVSQITVGDHILFPIEATAKSLKGYGWIIGQPAGVVHHKIDFYGKEVRVTNPTEFKSNNDTTLNLVSFTQRPYKVHWMEYHTKHTQAFIPLTGKPFYIILSKPTQHRPDGSWDETQKSQPDLDDVKAFYFNGSGVLLYVLAHGIRYRFPSMVIQILSRFSPIRRTTI
jgi:ureidoglycolate lyase